MKTFILSLREIPEQALWLATSSPLKVLRTRLSVTRDLGFWLVSHLNRAVLLRNNSQCPETWVWFIFKMEVTCPLVYHISPWILPRITSLAPQRFHLISPASSQIKDVHSSVQLLSRVQLFVTPWTAACQASLSINNSQSLLKLMSIESVMPSNHLILSCPLLLPPSIILSIRVFTNESVLHIRWPKY